MEAAISCPNGVTGREIVFLIHGTGSNANNTSAHGPYYTTLSETRDVCWVRHLRCLGFFYQADPTSGRPARQFVRGAQRSAAYVACVYELVGPITFPDRTE